MHVDLSKYNNSWYNPGRGFITCIVWYLINVIFLQNPLNPSSKLKIIILSLFGAKIGKGVVIKPGINIKYPWNLEIGDYSWIGENAWLDSLVSVKVGNNVCISQGVYICTGSHDWNSSTFNLIVKPIIIEDSVWIGAKAIISPGVVLKTHSVITAGSVVTKDTEPYTIYQGSPATPVKERIVK
jgi:putative colanic acid biosynthesis acetyltransferase WcaF